MADLSVLTQDWVATWEIQEPTRQYIQLYTAASTSWTAPTGVTAVKVELWGGGGTGGTAQGNPSYAGGTVSFQFHPTRCLLFFFTLLLPVLGQKHFLWVD